jgi:LuxR family transcriptional regulator, maltose regulon positive regulatory protein
VASTTAQSPAGVLLGTKLTPPSGARMPVSRVRLVERLVGERPRRLTLVDAPPGWGKTTLLAEWVAHPNETRRFAWLTLDPADNDPVRFWTYAVAALRSAAPGVSGATHSLLGVTGTDARDAALPQLINELSSLDGEFVLVLEDYHVIESADVHAGVEFLLAHLPATLEVAIAARIDPPLPLARLRARGELLEIRAAELAFTRDETNLLLRGVLGEGLSDEHLELLVGRTEGWAAGLYLAALSLARRDDRQAFVEHLAAADRHIVDYLGGEVLDGLDEATRDFLLKTSVLERLTGPLCDAVTGAGDGAQRLEEIERANLFLVPLDGHRRWYRYHHLFRELLRQELAFVDPVSMPELHLRAASWLEGEGEIDEAIRHACAAGETALAAALVSEHWRAAFNRGELTTVDRWLDELPEARVASAQDLSLARAWVAMDRGRAREAEQWLERATTGGSGEATVLHAVLCFKLGKVEHAQRIAREALAIASEESPLGLAVAYCILGITSYYSGRLDDADAALQEAARLSLRGGNQLARIYALGYLALVRLEQGAAAASQLNVDEAYALAPGPPLTEHFVLATTHLAAGRLTQDEQRFEQALALARRGAAPMEIASVQLALGELLRDAATLRAARETLAGCDDPGRLLDAIESAERKLRGRRTGPRRPIAGDLSDRELAVLKLMPTDSSLREIGDALFLSQNTIKTHTRSIYRKLGATNREQAVVRGRELGLLDRSEAAVDGP